MFVAEELEVRFFEGLTDTPEWEGFGSFTQKDIHQSVALTIRIPEYTKQMVRSKQQVMVQLRKRHSPQECSAARKFFYLNAGKLRRRLLTVRLRRHRYSSLINWVALVECGAASIGLGHVHVSS